MKTTQHRVLYICSLHVEIRYLLPRCIINIYIYTDCIPNVNYKIFRRAEALSLYVTDTLNIDRISLDKNNYFLQRNIKWALIIDMEFILYIQL